MHLVHHERYGLIELTPDGNGVAEMRDPALRDDTALLARSSESIRDGCGRACMMEHAVSPATVERMQELLKRHRKRRPRLPLSRRPGRASCAAGADRWGVSGVGPRDDDARVLCGWSSPSSRVVAPHAQESPYFHRLQPSLEEPARWNRPIPMFAKQRGGKRLPGGLVEIEYGVNAWWTTSLPRRPAHLPRQHRVHGVSAGESLPPLVLEHAINPLLYVEYEDISRRTSRRHLDAERRLRSFAPSSSVREDGRSSTFASRVMSSYSDVRAAGLIACSSSSGRKRFSQRKPVNRCCRGRCAGRRGRARSSTKR